MSRVFKPRANPRLIDSWDKECPLSPVSSEYEGDIEINKRIALWSGNITHLEVDAIQNAAKNSLLGGGGIDGAIHSAAGRKLVAECRKLGGCETGDTKITKGYELPAKHVLHTVGPVGEKPEKLQSCYRTTLDLALKNNLKTIALCGVSTGIFGYPREKAAHVACKTVREWLMKDDNWKQIDLIIFVTFLYQESIVYRETLPLYFPKATKTKQIAAKVSKDPIELPNLTLYYLTLSGLCQ